MKRVHECVELGGVSDQSETLLEPKGTIVTALAIFLGRPRRGWAPTPRNSDGWLKRLARVAPSSEN